jgi:hypothetical protein
LKDESSKYLSHENASFRMETIRQPTLFQMEKSSQAAKLVGEPKIERPYSLGRNFARHFRVHSKRLGRQLLPSRYEVTRFSFLRHSVCHSRSGLDILGHSTVQTTLSGYQQVQTDDFRAPLNEMATELLSDVIKRAWRQLDVLKLKELVNRGGLEPPTR